MRLTGPPHRGDIHHRGDRTKRHLAETGTAASRHLELAPDPALRRAIETDAEVGPEMNDVLLRDRH
jgi:hypothetical protein